MMSPVGIFHAHTYLCRITVSLIHQRVLPSNREAQREMFSSFLIFRSPLYDIMCALPPLIFIQLYSAASTLESLVYLGGPDRQFIVYIWRAFRLMKSSGSHRTLIDSQIKDCRSGWKTENTVLSQAFPIHTHIAKKPQNNHEFGAILNRSDQFSTSYMISSHEKREKISKNL